MNDHIHQFYLLVRRSLTETHSETQGLYCECVLRVRSHLSAASEHFCLLSVCVRARCVTARVVLMFFFLIFFIFYFFILFLLYILFLCTLCACIVRTTIPVLSAACDHVCVLSACLTARARARACVCVCVCV